MLAKVLVCFAWAAALGCSGGSSSSTENGAAADDGGGGGDAVVEHVPPERSSGGEGGAAPHDDTSGDGVRAGAPGNATAIPEANAERVPCIISADCPAGGHCQLGECSQDCNTELACERGLACSLRGRCLSPETPDADPPPVAGHQGSVRAEPTSVELSERDRTFSLRLTSDAEEPVHYRVELNAPFLELQDEERGTFDGGIVLHFGVDGSELRGSVTPGTVLIRTSLGDVLVNASIRVGVTGTYQGILRYESGKAPLGDVGFVADIHDDRGDVALRIDPENSMTFPASSSSAAAAGRGIFTFTDGLSVAVTHSIEGSYGGNRNHFQRPVGRRLSFRLAPATRGKFEGTFEETIYGIFEAPIVLQGRAYLEPRDLGRTAAFRLPEVLPMPTVSPGTFTSLSVFSGWQDGDCATLCPSGRLECLPTGATYYEAFARALSAPRTSADPLGDLALACGRDLALAPSSAGRTLPTPACTLVPALACGLRQIASSTLTTDELQRARTLYPRQFAETLAMPLFVAQDHIVQGLRDSFLHGMSAERERFEAARSALDPALTFLLSPGLLEWLRVLPTANAAGDSSADPVHANYPAGRALGRALYVVATLDDEEARLDAANVIDTHSEKLARAQRRGVISFLEAATLASVLTAWGNPPGIGNEFAGALTVSDRGFTALQHGALAFGVADREVPMLYDPGRPQPTNFEQILQLRAQPALEQFQTDETAFAAASREFEHNEARLRDELEAVRRSADDQLRDICGASFDLTKVRTDADWKACGADGTGELGETTLGIEQALLGVRASQLRLQGMYQKVAIDEQRLKDIQGVREKSLRFISKQGREFKSLVIAEGIVNVCQKTLEIASNASLWNAGAPVGMAAAAAYLETMRTSINVRRQELETHQQMQAVEDQLAVEVIDGMAAIKKQLVDMGELGLEIDQAALGVVQADLRRRNAVDRAKRLFTERARSLDRISESPLLDPMYRVLKTRLALQTVSSRTEAQRWLYRAARALEYEINTPIGTPLGRAVFGAYNTMEADRLTRCLTSIFNEHAAEFGIPQEFATTISVREMLGITGPRKDEVTGEVLSEGELFRRAILRNESIDSHGNVSVSFPTNLEPGNKLWSTNVCDDKVVSVQAQLVGDFQGDNEAELHVALEGGSVMRRCDSDELIHWAIDSSVVAVLQAGVNTFGEVRPNTSLSGQSVARASWTLVIPSGNSSPANDEVDLQHLDDIVLKIAHRALPKQSRAVPLDVSCLGRVGAGG